MTEEYEAKLVRDIMAMNLDGIETETAENIATAFAKFDEKENGYIDISELKATLAEAGHDLPGYKIRELTGQWKLATPGEITLTEFATKMSDLKKGGFEQKIKTQVKEAQGLVVKARTQSKRSYHAYEVEERVGFADWVNRIMKKDPEVQHLLPIDLDTEDLFEKTKDGIILCKLINSAIKDTIDDRAINKPKNGVVDEFRRVENINLALNSASSIGCTVVNIGQGDIKKGSAHLILGLMWQIIEIGLMAGVDLATNPNLVVLLEEDETLADLERLGPEAILLRWVNYHLARDPKYEAGPITNFKKDIRDSVAYTHLLAQIQPEDHYPRISNDTTANDDMDRAEKMLKKADTLDARAFVTPRDICNGHEKLNLAFVANLFNNYPALEAGDIEIIVETREEKTFRNWMNSQGLSPKIRKLYYDIEDGCNILYVMDKVKPGCVDHKRINKPPYKALAALPKKIENCNYAIDLGKKLNFSLVGVAGNDILDHNPTLTLALLWQMMRAYTVKVLTELGDGKPVKDQDIINWVNSKIPTPISSFKDPRIKTSMPFYELLNAIKPGTIDYTVIDKNPKEDSDKFSNAKYALSMARKIGAVVYTLPEDIVESNPKMIMTAFACLMVLDTQSN